MEDDVEISLRRTRELILENRYAEAYEALLPAHNAKPPRDKQVLFLLVQLKFHEGAPEAHLEWIQQVHRMGKRSRALELSLDFLRRDNVEKFKPEIYRWIAELHLEEGNFDSALDFLRTADGLNAGQWETQIVLGRVLLQKALHRDAREVFENVLLLFGEENPPVRALTYTWLARLYRMEGASTDTVLSCWQRAAEAYENCGMHAEARTAWKTVLELKPVHPKAAESLHQLQFLLDPLSTARTLLAQGDLGGAAREIVRRLARHPEDGQALELRSQCLRALEPGNPHPPDPLTIGQLYFELGRYAEAELEFRTILRKDLNHLSALFGLGRVCQASGNWREAALCFRRIQSIDPTHWMACEHLAEVYLQQNAPQDAIKSYLWAAQGYLDADQRSQALRIYQLVLELDSSHPTARRQLADLEDPPQKKHRFSQKLEIRPYRGDDEDAVWAILEPVIRAGETYTLDRELSREEGLSYWLEHSVWVACLDGVVAGTYYLRRNQHGGGSHVCNCGYMTSAAFQGRGLAGEMCVHSMQMARNMGFRAMQFNFVVVSNEGAVRLWRKHGFREVGRIPQAFEHPRLGFQDALVLWRSLL